MFTCHRLCASSPVRLCLAVLSLMVACLGTSTVAYAGTYMWQTTDSNGTVTAQSPTYSVGQISFRGGPGPEYDRAYTWSYQGCGVSDGRGLATDISCSGANQATFTWQPDAGKTLVTDPPPDQVIVKESASALTNAQNYVTSPPTGGCSDGLGDSQSLILTPDGQGYVSGHAACSRTRYSTHTGGQMVTLPSCEPTAHSANNSSESRVSYSAVLYAVTVNVIGCNANNQALTGQQITTSLNIPSGFTDDVNTYQWSVVTTASPPVASVDAFETYTSSATSHPFVSLSAADLTGLHMNFYDKKKETVLVKCNVTLVAPDGTTRIAATAQSQPIAFLKPSLTSSSIINGYVYKDPVTANRWGMLPDPTTSYNDGMVWKDLTVDIPSPFPSGQCCLTQLVTPDRENYTDGVAADRVTDNKVLGLDNSFQLGPPPAPGGPDPWTPPTLGNDSDSSGIYQTSAGDQHFNKITVADGFTTWVMYRPPAATYNGNTLQTVWVPLAKSSWSWGCTLEWKNNAWALTSATPLSVSTKPAYAFSDTNDPPDWLVIHHNGN